MGNILTTFRITSFIYSRFLYFGIAIAILLLFGIEVTAQQRQAPVEADKVNPTSRDKKEGRSDDNLSTDRPVNYDALDKSCKKIISKTSIQVKVVLRADGKVGEVKKVLHKYDACIEKAGLYGLATNAAKQIRFTPKRENGVPVSTIVTLEYDIRIK